MHIQAAVVRQKSGPFVLEDIELDEPRADEVIVRVVSAGICHTDLIPREQANRSPVETAVTRMRPRLRPFSTIRTVRSSIYRRVVVLRPTRRPRAQGVLAQGVEMQVDVEPAVAAVDPYRPAN